MKDNVVLILGATSMIGDACARLFSQYGMKLMLVAKDENKLRKLAHELNENVEFCIADLSSSDQINLIVNKTLKSFNRIDTVIHNVAIYPWKKIDELSLAEWNNTLNINLTSAFLATQSVFSVMKKQRVGNIIFMSSIAGEKIGLPDMSAYSASKAGLNGFMRTAALEFAPYNVNVNSISPGRMYDASTLTQNELEKKLAPIPLQRFIKPSDIANMAMFLLSDKAINITGQNFIIDGGQTICTSIA